MVNERIDLVVAYHLQGAEQVIRSNQNVASSNERVNKSSRDSMTIGRGVVQQQGTQLSLAERMARAKRKEHEAYVMATHTVDQHTGNLKEMSMWQKISIGQWKTAYPALTRLNNALNTVRWTMVNVTFAIAAIAALTSPFWLLTKQGIEYEEQLRKIASVSGEVYQSQRGIQSLTGAVAGVAIGRPATFADAASAMLEFQRAGFGLSDAMRDVPHIIDLSVAGFVDLTTATKIVTSVLHQFSNQGLTAQHAADVIAKAAVSSATSVEEFGHALNYAGAMAASSGFEFEETAAALALLSNAGMRGSRAGTTLRQVLSKVSTMSRQGEESMNRLGLSFFNAEGQIKSLQEIFSQLKVVMEGMTQEERARFVGDMFEIRSRAGIMALLNVIDQSSTAIDDFADVLRDSGFAARTAADIQQASALRMRTAWGNLMVGLQPVATAFNNIFGSMIERVEDFSSRFLFAMRRGGLIGGTIDAMTELPLTIQLMSLLAVMRMSLPVIAKVNTALTGLAVSTMAAQSTFAIVQTPAITPLAATAAASRQAGTRTAAAVAGGALAGSTIGRMPKLAQQPPSIANIDKSIQSVGKLARVKQVAAGAGGMLVGSLKKLAAMFGPIGMAIAGAATTFLFFNKALKDASRLTDDQVNVLLRYQTQIDILGAREDYFTENFMDNAAKRTVALRKEFEEADKEFEKHAKRLSRIESSTETGISRFFYGPTMFANMMGDFGTIREFGLSALFASSEDRATMAAERQRELQEEHTEYQRESIRQEEARQDVIERSAYVLNGFIRNSVEGQEEFAQYTSDFVNSLVESSQHYQTMIDNLEQLNDIQRDLESGVIDEAEAARRTEAVDRERFRTLNQMTDELGLHNEEVLKYLELANEAYALETARTDAIRTQGNELANIIREQQRELTPESGRLFSDFGDENQLFGIGGVLDTLRLRIPEATEYINDLLEAFWTKHDTLQELETEYDAVTRIMERYNNKIQESEIRISSLNDELRIHDDMIRQLTSQRFEGETALDRVIFDVSQDIQRASLEAMGITDVYKFIQDAVGGVEGAFDGVLAAVRAVDEATNDSTATYDAWQRTVRAHISALINQGNNLATATTRAVRRHSTLLMSVENFGDSTQKQMTDEEIMLDALTQARDYYYGGMHEQVKLAIQDHEDMSAVSNKTADTVIEALKREWSQRDIIVEKIDEQRRRIDFLRTSYEIGGQTMSHYASRQHDLRVQIQRVVESITGPNGLILGNQLLIESVVGEDGVIDTNNLEINSVRDLIKYHNDLAAAKARSGSRPSSSPATGGGSSSPPPNMSLPGGTPIYVPPPSNDLPMTPFLPITPALPLTPAPISFFDDFVMRPNQEPFAFSKDDTLVGFKGDSPFGGGIGEINIHINANTNDAKRLASTITKEIKRELRAL